MRIDELIVETQETDEAISLGGFGRGIGKAIGGAAKVAGSIPGGVAGAWQAAKQGYAAGKAAVSGENQPLDRAATKGTTTSGTSSTTPAAEPQSTAPTANVSQASTDPLDQLKAEIGKLNPQQKQELAGELEKSMSGTLAAPAHRDQSVDLDQLKQQRAAQQAQGQQSQQQAVQQMKQTQQANANTSAADNELKAAVKAAKAKPGFQQTSQDKLTIKQGAAKGIYENKKKTMIEFKSRFLGINL